MCWRGAVAGHCNLARPRSGLLSRRLEFALVTADAAGLGGGSWTQDHDLSSARRNLNVVRSAASLAPVVAIVCCVLRRNKFRFGHAVQAIQGDLLDVDVLADQV